MGDRGLRHMSVTDLPDVSPLLGERLPDVEQQYVPLVQLQDVQDFAQVGVRQLEQP